MHVEPRVVGQPFADRRGLVGAVVVADQMNGQVCRDCGVDLGQE